jgi:deoxycytidylate deaminase
MQASLKTYQKNEESTEQIGKTSREQVENTLTDELIIAICAPIGTSREKVISELKLQLQKTYNYDVEIIKLSDYIAKYVEIEDAPQPGETLPFTQLMAKIKGGDEMRENNTLSCLAELAIVDILQNRIGNSYTTEELPSIIDSLKSRRICYIIDSLKHKEELNLFRAVYGSIFYSFSIFSPEEERRDNLTKKGLSGPEVKKIIDTDEFEDHKHGQNVRDTFVEADFFIRASEENLKIIDKKVERYLDVLFESNVVTPSPDEIAMYEAQSAAGNSACLSRQVGAAITNSIGEIISRGWNDVPKFGGNLYKDGMIDDNRCFTKGFCSNDTTKDNVAENIIESILKNDELKSIIPLLDGVEKSDKIYKLLEVSIRRNSKVKDLIEFSRSVHAEMHAIIIGSQLAGDKMIRGKLFCTTYPCHNCARHIIVAGITEIYYIEPYKKSLGIHLHEDAITEDEKCLGKTKILMFDGIAPRRYLEFFSLKNARKDKQGQAIIVNKSLKSPKSRLSLQALPTLEIQSVHSLKQSGLIN